MDVRTRVCLSICAFVCVQILVVKSLTLTRDEKQIIDYTEITIRETHVQNRRDVAGITKNTDDDGILPSAVDMDFKVKKEKISFHLRRNDRISTNVPVYLMRKGGIKRMDLPPIRNTTFYTDVNSGATVHITCARSEKRYCIHLVTGMFMYQNEIVMIEPGEYKDDEGENITGSQTDKAECPRLAHTQIHRVFTTKFEPNLQSDYIVPEGKPLPLRSIVNYQVELLCVVDFPIYDFWYRRSTAITDAARRADAVETVREFYSFVVNAIDLRYQSIVSRKISIRVLFSGIYIAQTPSDSPWTEKNKIHANVARDQVDAIVALLAFAEWKSTKLSFPKYDHVMVFTGYDLTVDSTKIAGFGLSDAICLFYSIVQDYFGASIALTAAHELGHNLGADHDGENNTCLASDGYVMSPSVTNIRDARDINKWKFSTCSVTMFENLMDKLNAASNNCLLNLTSIDPSALTSYQDIMPGQVYGIDTQCELIFGAGSVYCREDPASDDSVCRVLYCSIPGKDNCWAKAAWEGTSCGNSMWCQAGKCVSDARAPAKNSMCVHGNQPGIVIANMTCEQLISSFPAVCAFDNKTCCESCARYDKEWGRALIVTFITLCKYMMYGPILKLMLKFCLLLGICIKICKCFRRRKPFGCCGCVFIIFLLIFICFMFLVLQILLIKSCDSNNLACLLA